MGINLGLVSLILGSILAAPSAVLAGQTTYQGSCLSVVETSGKEPTATYDCDRVVVADGVSYPDDSIDFRFLSPKGNGLMFVTDRGHIRVGKGWIYKLRSYSDLSPTGLISEPIEVTGFCEIGVKGENNIGCTAQVKDSKLSIVLTPAPKKASSKPKVYRSMEEASWGDD